MSGQPSISIPGKFRESKGLCRSHSTLTQGPGLLAKTLGLSSKPLDGWLFQSLLHIPGDGGSVPLPKVTPSQLGQLALHPGCPVLSLCSVLAGLDLAMPGEAGGLSSVRLPVADTHPVGTRRLHPSPSPWGWPPHTAPYLQTAPWRPALQPGPAENQTK